MKTIEEKAEAYDRAFEIAKKVHRYSSDIAEIKRMEEIFPELKESEDERIRKEIIKLVKFYYGLSLVFKHTVSKDEMVAWLEKLKVFAEHGDGLYYFANDEFTYVGNPTWDNVSFLEDGQETLCDKCRKSQLSHSCQDITALGRCALENEQKPADKVEPKFHEGDWTVSNLDGRARQISEVHFDEYNSYYVVNGKSVNLEEYDRLHHLWSIEDARDGDVLAEDSCIFIIQKLCDNNTAAKTYFTLYDDDDFDDSSVLYFDINSTKPATNEQCNTLFAKMREAGYMWNYEKKKLKKIEQKLDKCSEPQITIGTKIRSKENPDLILSIISNDCHEDKFECSNGSVLSLKQIEKYYDIIK